VKNGLSTLSLQIAIFCFGFIIIMTVMTVFGKKNFGYLFWGTECLALTGMIMYTVFLSVMGEKHWMGLDNAVALGLNKFDKETAENVANEDRSSGRRKQSISKDRGNQ
jgi:hypothetical protein